MKQQQTRIAALSYLRIVGTLGVILMHAASTLTDNPDLFPLSGGEQAFFRAIIRCMTWCVPCFLMVTGALLLKREKPVSIADCVFKYARRAFLALVVFGIPFAMMIEFASTRRLSLSLIPNAIVRILSNDSFAHLWYLYMLIGIYLLLPMIKAFTDNCTDEALGYILLVLYVFNFVLPAASALSGIAIAFKLPAESCYLFYLLAGHYLTRRRPAWSSNAALMLSTVALCLSATVVACACRWDRADVVASYSSPVTALCAAAVFSLFGRLKGETPARALALDRLTFGVYLIHPLFIHVLYRLLGITPAGSLFFIMLPVIACGVAVASFLATRALMLIRPLREYVL